MNCYQKSDEDSYLEEIKTKCSFNEIKKLMVVLNKNEDIERRESKRVKMLERELNFFRKIIREIEIKTNHCSICNSQFIICFNPVNICQFCQNEVCGNCMVFIKSPKVMQLCKLCYKEWLKQVKSGNWLLEMAKETDRQISVLERNQKLPMIQKEIERLLQEKVEYSKANDFKTQIDNLICKKDNLHTNRYEPYDDSGNLNDFVKHISASVDNLSKSYSASSGPLKALINSKNDREILSDIGCCQERPLSRNSQSPPNSERLRKKQKELVINEENHTQDKICDQIIPNGDVPSDNERFLKLARSSANSYSSMNSSEYFTNDFIVQGEILLKIEHIQNISLLKIMILKCRNLIIANRKENTTNPYIKLYLLPDKSPNGKRKTSVKKNITSPIFNEELSYKIDRNSLIGRTLNVSVWHQESLKGNLFLGETNIPIYNIRLNNAQECWHSLKTKEAVPQILSLYQYKGEILIGLQFIQNTKRRNSETISEYETGKLNIFIQSGKHIGDEKNIPNSFVRCTIKHIGIQVGKKETKVVSNTTNPIWDEVFTFNDIDKLSLGETEIELCILNKKLIKTQMLGKLLLSTTCSETNVATCREKDVLLWTKFLITPNQEKIEDYLPIRSITE